MKISKFLGAIALVTASALGLAANAAAQTTAFDFFLTIDRIDAFNTCNPLASSHYSFGCVSVGETFNGHFSVDSAILGTDGENRTAPVYDFFLPFGNALYSQGADNQTLSGFRNGLGFSSAPGFVIAGGQVVDLIGGVYGRADVPFIDFYGYPSTGRNSFVAYDGTTAAYGTLNVAAAVPEPETYAMLAIGLGAVVWTARRRRAAASTS